MAFGLAAAISTGCQIIGGALEAVGGIKGTFKGTVKDPNGTSLANAAIKVYSNVEIASVTKTDKDPKGKTQTIVDLEKLSDSTPKIPVVTTGADGTWEVRDLNATDGPFVVVATNKRGQDFRGIDRETRKLFDFKFTPGKIPDVNANSVVFPNPAAPTVMDFVLPNDTPPPPPPPATPEPEPTPLPNAPTPVPNATLPPQGSADDVSQNSKLPPPAPVQNTDFKNSLKAVVLDGLDPGSGESGSNGFVLYKLKGSDLEETSVSSKVLIQASATGVTAATLRISHVPADKTKKATISEVPVSFRDGKLVSDHDDGYIFAVPRDGAKTVLQLRDDATGATSNAIALDGSGMDPSKVRPLTVILTWDQGEGTDVDLHVYDIDSDQEAWFGEMEITKGSLDLDNTEGFGPETFTSKAGHFALSVNYWLGTKPVKVEVRVITANSDKTYEKTLAAMGDIWDVGEYKADD